MNPMNPKDSPRRTLFGKPLVEVPAGSFGDLNLPETIVLAPLTAEWSIKLEPIDGDPLNCKVTGGMLKTSFGERLLTDAEIEAIVQQLDKASEE